MVYAHNSEADFAGSELARMFAAAPALCYSGGAAPSGLSASASFEPSTSRWPLADGLISLLESGTTVRREVALEYKRPQEGVHGLLTGMGQAHGYLHKGYNGAAIVIPRQYSTHLTPAAYVKDVLDKVSGSKAIGVFHYDEPDVNSPTPFAGRLHCIRPFDVTTPAIPAPALPASPKTQWVHVREGSTTRDHFLRFLQIAKRLSGGDPLPPANIPGPLRAAVGRCAPGKDVEAYLANTADDKPLSRIWRAFWFSHMATHDVLTPWKNVGGRYETPRAFTGLRLENDRGHQQLWEGRANGLKETLVDLLNGGVINEAKGWELFADGIPAQPGRQKKQGVRERAHSAREDLDSSLLQLQLITTDGIPTDSGYRYMTICERYGGANSSAAMDYMGAVLLQTGRIAALLHYIDRLSEQKFAADPLAFTETTPHGPAFTERSYTTYLEYLMTELTDNLKVVRKVSGRARPRVRTVLQAELTWLRNYGFVSKRKHRLGVGIPINWEKVMDALSLEL